MSGLPELMRELDRLGARIEAGVLKAVEESAQAVRTDARGAVRVDTGRLQRGLTVRVDRARLLAEVGWFDPKLYYAAFQEHGTSSIPANPALTSAAESERPRFPRRLAAEIEREIGR
ncbi:HK97 gp10 family phage protein [Actinocorallia sp. API 0066]|uniref:HK97 gp10 family phage protein n=1 Tax=Actinocorallia sp. API 0066 TaxID=2896846 RepID=UPI001E2AEB2E|nr:HK97 gp10 family phage protein [Actinocorallia sp. API 0066]MCD0450768.1 HK97 gp10 family phage protein [Actinocorallia sp. API 0066]